MHKPNSINILYIGTLPPHPGGSAIVGYHLLAGLSQFGHKVRALSPISSEAISRGDSFAQRHPEIKITRYNVPYFQIETSTDLSSQFRTWEGDKIRNNLTVMLADRLPDIIIIGRESCAWHVPDIAKAYNLPCLALVQGPTFHRILEKTYPEQLGQELLAKVNMADRVVAVANHQLNVLQRLGVGHVKLIPNPVDTRRFSPKPKNSELGKKLGIDDDSTVILHASNLKSIKRPFDIIHSAEKVLRYASNLVYLIVGDGPCRHEMQEACKQKRISEKFRFVGWVDHELMPDFINLADVVIMPSEIEMQAMIYLEAQSCGRLLLVSDIPAAREVVVDGETGLLFRMGDIDDLVAKTLRAASDDSLRTRVGSKARDQIMSHDINQIMALYTETIEELIEGRRWEPMPGNE